MLKINEGATVDKHLTLTQSMLDDAKARINELETDNRYFIFSQSHRLFICFAIL